MKTRTVIILWILAIIALVIFFNSTAHAQPTNLVSQNQTATPVSGQPSPAAVKIAGDVYQLVLDVIALCTGVSGAGAGLTLYLGLKFIRTRTPLGTNPAIAPWLNLLNLEAKGDYAQPTTSSAAPPAAPPATQKG